jgi:hypothetical protein
MFTSSKNQKMNRMTNYMEELAEGVLGDLISKNHERFSPTAIQDIKALALNRLWPMYSTTESGRDYLRKVVEEDRIEKDVIRELRIAMDIVRLNPR